jgi:phosphonopyruvate decarboxylase
LNVVDAREFLDAVRQHRAGLFTGVPCSLLKPLINHVILDDSLRYVSAVSEGEAVGIAAGSSLTGQIGVVMLQNSGLGNAVNPITSLTNIYKIPCLFVVSHRGDPEGKKDAVQHSIMGRLTNDLLDLLGVYRQDFPSASAGVGPAVGHAFSRMQRNSLPAAFVLKRDVVIPFDPGFPAEHVDRESGAVIQNDEPARVGLTRQEAVAEIGALLHEWDLVVSATGKISRELFTCCDRPGNFYMQGSMGTTAAIGLGVALGRPERQMVILDGDGAVLMRMGSLATVGYYQPSHYLHIVLDNASYDSTGGQQSAAPAVSFPDVAVAAGYRRAVTVYSLAALRGYWQQFLRGAGPSMLHIKVLKGADKKLGRPTWAPEEIRDRFMASVNG